MRRALILLTAALLAPASAHAATVHVGDGSKGTEFGYLADYGYQRLYYGAAPGERNRLTIAMRHDFTSVTVTDPAAKIKVGTDCERIDEHSARCFSSDPNDPYVSSAEARLGDEDDEVHRANGYYFGRVIPLGAPLPYPTDGPPRGPPLHFRSE